MSIYHSRDFDSLFRGLGKAEQDPNKERLKEIRLQLDHERARRARLENDALEIRNENARMILDLKRKFLQEGRVVEAAALTDSHLMMFLAQSRAELAKIQGGIQQEKEILALERSHLEQERALLAEERKLLQGHSTEYLEIDSGAKLFMREAEHKMQASNDIYRSLNDQIQELEGSRIPEKDKAHVRLQLYERANQIVEGIFS